MIPVKMSFVNTIAAFDSAVALRPDIITCSWGSNSPFALSAADMVLAASIAAAVASGITVIFSAGNGHAGFPGQHPDVISAGGVFVTPEGTLQASDYASAFASQIYPGRASPDLCGLVGMRPKAIYIMLPVQPGDNIDVGNAGGVFPNGDQTNPNDGWAAFSGTSAAAPQLAGVAALVKQVAPNISPAQVKAVLEVSARDVVEGVSSPVVPLNAGLPAGPGPDEATGAGLVDAYSAAVTAYLAASAALLAPPQGQDLVTAAYLQGMADAAAAITAQYYGVWSPV
jgi:subtilisin family serine protease